MEKNFVTVQFSFEPAVVRYLENNFCKNSGVIDLRKTHIYPFLVLCLQRTHVKSKSSVPSSFNSYQEVNIAVKEWDYSHFGNKISPFAMIQLNNAIYKQIIRDACYRIMIAHVFSGIPRDTCIKDYLFECYYTEEELNYAALRKYYQRNWMSKEKELRENLSFHLNSENEKQRTIHVQPAYNSSTYKNVTFVPMGFLN